MYLNRIRSALARAVRFTSSSASKSASAPQPPAAAPFEEYNGTMPSPSWSLQQLGTGSGNAPAVTVAELHKIAQLANLSIPEERVERAHSDIAGMIAWCGQVRHVRTDGVSPMFTPLQQHRLPNANRQVAGAGIGGAPPLEVGVQLRTRPDVIDEGGQAKKVLQNAARKEGAYFVAPKMIDHDDS